MFRISYEIATFSALIAKKTALHDLSPDVVVRTDSEIMDN